jgi:hypothetical protein
MTKRFLRQQIIDGDLGWLIPWGRERGIAPVEGAGPGGLPTVEEAAKAVGRSGRWLRMQMAKGAVRYTTVGRTPYPVKTFLLEMLARNEHPSRSEGAARPGRYGRPIATSEEGNGGANLPKAKKTMVEARRAAAEVRESRRQARESRGMK